MSRIKLILLGGLAALSVGLTSSSAASAAQFLVCLKTSGTPEFTNADCNVQSAGGGWSMQPIGGTSLAVTVAGLGSYVLKGKLLGNEILILCASASGTGSLESSGKSTGEITFTGCKIKVFESGKEEETGCTVANINFKFKDQLLSTTEDEFKPSTGTTFVKIKITGCGLASNSSVEGTQVCTASASTPALLQAIVCAASGSSLKYAGETATFEGSFSLTASTGAWDVS
jgi:hypothetical protein